MGVWGGVTSHVRPVLSSRFRTYLEPIYRVGPSYSDRSSYSDPIARKKKPPSLDTKPRIQLFIFSIIGRSGAGDGDKSCEQPVNIH